MEPSRVLSVQDRIRAFNKNPDSKNSRQPQPSRRTSPTATASTLVKTESASKLSSKLYSQRIAALNERKKLADQAAPTLTSDVSENQKTILQDVVSEEPCMVDKDRRCLVGRAKIEDPTTSIMTSSTVLFDMQKEKTTEQELLDSGIGDNLVAFHRGEYLNHKYSSLDSEEGTCEEDFDASATLLQWKNTRTSTNNAVTSTSCNLHLTDAIPSASLTEATNQGFVCNESPEKFDDSTLEKQDPLYNSNYFNTDQNIVHEPEPESEHKSELLVAVESSADQFVVPPEQIYSSLLVEPLLENEKSSKIKSVDLTSYEMLEIQRTNDSLDGDRDARNSAELTVAIADDNGVVSTVTNEGAEMINPSPTESLSHTLRSTSRVINAVNAESTPNVTYNSIEEDPEVKNIESSSSNMLTQESPSHQKVDISGFHVATKNEDTIKSQSPKSASVSNLSYQAFMRRNRLRAMQGETSVDGNSNVSETTPALENTRNLDCMSTASGNTTHSSTTVHTTLSSRASRFLVNKRKKSPRAEGLAKEITKNILQGPKSRIKLKEPSESPLEAEALICKSQHIMDLSLDQNCSSVVICGSHCDEMNAVQCDIQRKVVDCDIVPTQPNDFNVPCSTSELPADNQIQYNLINEKRKSISSAVMRKDTSHDTCEGMVSNESIHQAVNTFTVGDDIVSHLRATAPLNDTTDVTGQSPNNTANNPSHFSYLHTETLNGMQYHNRGIGMRAFQHPIKTGSIASLEHYHIQGQTNYHSDQTYCDKTNSLHPLHMNPVLIYGAQRNPQGNDDWVQPKFSRYNSFDLKNPVQSLPINYLLSDDSGCSDSKNQNSHFESSTPSTRYENDSTVVSSVDSIPNLSSFTGSRSLDKGCLIMEALHEACDALSPSRRSDSQFFTNLPMKPEDNTHFKTAFSEGHIDEDVAIEVEYVEQTEQDLDMNSIDASSIYSLSTRDIDSKDSY